MTLQNDKSMKKIFVSAIAAVLACSVVYAQKCVNPHFDAQRLDFRDLGYPGATELPADDTPIVALLGHTNGRIYGATTGKQSYLFTFDPMTNKVYPLGRIPGARGVHHCILEGKGGIVYLGGGLNEIELLTLSKDMPHGRRAIENQLWADIKAKYDAYEGGHLYAYDPVEGDDGVYFNEEKAKVKDLGIAVPGNSVYAMTIDPAGEKIYGISYPDAVFFEYDIAAGTFKQYGKWMEMLSYPGPERSWRGVPRALAVSSDGKVWSSGDNGLLHCFDPANSKIVPSMMRVPGEYWETQNYNAFPVVEQLFAEEDGTLFGTSSDGFVFRAIPSEDNLLSFGKPRVERRIRCTAKGQDGRWYMICGEKDNVCRLFSYADGEGFIDYGVLGVDRSPYYAKIAYQFDAMATASDGSIFIGESDRRAKLFIFVPGARVCKGVLNPTNPR